MILRITSKPANDFKLGDKIMTPEDFADPMTHPYIVSREWERVYVDIDDEKMPTGILRQLVKVYAVKPVYGNIKLITTKGMLLLSEIYPDYSAKLRAYYMKDRNQFYDLVRQLTEL